MTRWSRGVFAAFVLVLAGCDIDDFDPGPRVKEDFHHSHALKSGGRVELEGFNGSVTVRGWDKETIEINGTKSAVSDEALRSIKIDIDSTPDSIRIRAVRPTEPRRWNMGVSFVLTVPRKVTLDRINSSNGSMRLEELEGSAKVRTSNGSIKVSNYKGDLEAHSSNGSVQLDNFTGGAQLTTSNGSIHAVGVRGFFEAATSNGGIDAQIVEASGSRPIRAESSNGRISLSLDQFKGNDVIASTSNSSIVVKLPSAVNARVKAVTSNSSINSDFDLTVRGAISKHRLEGTIGSGGPMLDLHTSNGGIRIQRM